MPNPSKQQGTAWETELVAAAKAMGYDAWRLAEGGSGDPGDLVVVTPDGDHYVLEAKNRTALNIHDALGKARGKAARADLPFHVAGTAVAWKRLVRKDGKQRREQAGPPVVAITVGEWLSLIGR